MSLLCRGMQDIQWMNLDPVKLMEELSQFTSLEGFKEMLDKAQVMHRKNYMDIFTKQGCVSSMFTPLIVY